MLKCGRCLAHLAPQGCYGGVSLASMSGGRGALSPPGIIPRQGWGNFAFD